MIAKLFSARVFTLVFGVAYAVAVFGDYPLFWYYPLATRFSLDDLVDPSLGPSMLWYGWIATAAIPAVIAALIVPRRIAQRIPTAVFWVLPFMVFAAGFYREQEWFSNPALEAEIVEEAGAGARG